MERHKSIGRLLSALILAVAALTPLSAQAIDLDRFIKDPLLDIVEELDRHVEEFLQGDKQEEEGIDLELWGTEATDTEGVMNTVLEISQLMYRTEADILFPANTHVTVFLSLADGSQSVPQSARISIDGRPVTSHKYNKGEQNSLRRAAVQRLYTGFIADGQHTLRADVTVGGKRVSKSLKFNKGERPQFVELRVSGASLQMKGWR